MFYKLKSDYMLRGWKLLPTGVINRETREYNFLPGKKFAVLKLCNGLFDSDSILFDDDQRKIMEELRAEGYVEANDTPSPLEDGGQMQLQMSALLHVRASTQGRRVHSRTMHGHNRANGGLRRSNYIVDGRRGSRSEGFLGDCRRFDCRRYKNHDDFQQRNANQRKIHGGIGEKELKAGFPNKF